MFKLKYNRNTGRVYKALTEKGLTLLITLGILGIAVWISYVYI